MSNIWIAASEGNQAAVASILDAELNLTPTSPDHNTYTPIHAAASYGHVSLLRFLLSHPKCPPGAADVTDEDGDTPLFVVEDIETAKVLIEEFGADPKRTNAEGRTAAYAMWESGWEEVSDWLRQRTGEAAFEDQDGQEVYQDGADDDGDDEKHDGEHTKRLVEALSEYSSCEISDALIKLKHPSGGHIPSLSLVSPRDSPSTKLCGQVFPVRMVASSDKSAPPKPATHFVDAAPKDSVMLVTAPSNTRSAVWGGLMTARAQARGVRGVVLDGNCRDLAEHWESGMTIFAKGHSTLGQAPFTRPATIGEPIELQSETVSPASDANPAFPTSTVYPADILLADVDGVVVVPRAQVMDVVELAKKGREVDARCLEDLKQGKGVAETFKKHRG